MKKFAQSPAEAMRHWPRLKTEERAHVIWWMSAFYDIGFAALFSKTAHAGGRPDLTHLITNSLEVTPESLLKKGFARKRQAGTAEVWVNASGMEVWLLPAPKAATPPDPIDTRPVQPPIPKPVRPHPDVEEIDSPSRNSLPRSTS